MRPRPTRARLMALVLISAASLGGCYQRTISASGVGSRATTTQDSYRSDTAADRWFDRTILGRKEPPQPGWRRVAPLPGQR